LSKSDFYPHLLQPRPASPGCSPHQATAPRPQTPSTALESPLLVPGPLSEVLADWCGHRCFVARAAARFLPGPLAPSVRLFRGELGVAGGYRITVRRTVRSCDRRRCWAGRRRQG
jgi:hypothetical protein